MKASAHLTLEPLYQGDRVRDVRITATKGHPRGEKPAGALVVKVEFDLPDGIFDPLTAAIAIPADLAKVLPPATVEAPDDDRD